MRSYRVAHTPRPVLRHEQVHAVQFALVHDIKDVRPLGKVLAQVTQDALALDVRLERVGQLVACWIDVVREGQAGSDWWWTACAELDVQMGWRHRVGRAVSEHERVNTRIEQRSWESGYALVARAASRCPVDSWATSTSTSRETSRPYERTSRNASMASPRERSLRGQEQMPPCKRAMTALRTPLVASRLQYCSIQRSVCQQMSENRWSRASVEHWTSGVVQPRHAVLLYGCTCCSVCR